MLDRFLGATSCKKINYAIQKVKDNVYYNKTYSGGRRTHIDARLVKGRGYRTMFSSSPIMIARDKQVNLGTFYFYKQFLASWEKDF